MGNDGALVVDTSQIEKAKKTVVLAFPRVRKNHFERFYLVVGVAFILCTPIVFHFSYSKLDVFTLIN